MLSEAQKHGWVFDEAHCFSKWGHDFRPDYHYAARFIRELAEEHGVPLPPVACFTATAKADVREEIIEHFRRELGQELRLFDGGAERDNLEFEIQPVNAAQKWERAHELLEERLAAEPEGSAVIYAATQKGAAEAADYLKRKGWRAEAFHGGIAVSNRNFSAIETDIKIATSSINHRRLTDALNLMMLARRDPFFE